MSEGNSKLRETQINFAINFILEIGIGCELTLNATPIYKQVDPQTHKKETEKQKTKLQSYYLLLYYLIYQNSFQTDG